jgi:hypothetical protein
MGTLFLRKKKEFTHRLLQEVTRIWKYMEKFCPPHRTNVVIVIKKKTFNF